MRELGTPGVKKHLTKRDQALHDATHGQFGEKPDLNQSEIRMKGYQTIIEKTVSKQLKKCQEGSNSRSRVM